MTESIYMREEKKNMIVIFIILFYEWIYYILHIQVHGRFIYFPCTPRIWQATMCSIQVISAFQRIKAMYDNLNKSNAIDIRFSQEYWVNRFLLALIWTHHLHHFIIYHSHLYTSVLLWKCCIHNFFV